MTQILTLKAKEDENEPFDILASAVTRVLRVRLGRRQKRWGEAVSAVLEGDLANVKAKNLYLRSRMDSLSFFPFSPCHEKKGGITERTSVHGSSASLAASTACCSNGSRDPYGLICILIIARI